MDFIFKEINDLYLNEIYDLQMSVFLRQGVKREKNGDDQHAASASEKTVYKAYSAAGKDNQQYSEPIFHFRSPSEP